MHASGVQPQEEWLTIGPGLVYELERITEDLVVDSFHSIWTQRTRVLNLLLSYLAPARLFCSVVLICRPRMHHVPWADRLFGRWRIVPMAWIFHRIEMVQVAEKLVEAVNCRQELVKIA